MLTITHGDATRRHLSSVLDLAIHPRTRSSTCAQCWSIEQTFRLVKQELGLHLLWPAQWALILTQIPSVLIIAQVT